MIRQLCMVACLTSLLPLQSRAAPEWRATPLSVSPNSVQVRFTLRTDDFGNCNLVGRCDYHREADFRIAPCPPGELCNGGIYEEFLPDDAFQQDIDLSLEPGLTYETFGSWTSRSIFLDEFNACTMVTCEESYPIDPAYPSFDLYPGEILVQSEGYADGLEEVSISIVPANLDVCGNWNTGRGCFQGIYTLKVSPCPPGAGGSCNGDAAEYQYIRNTDDGTLPPPWALQLDPGQLYEINAHSFMGIADEQQGGGCLYFGEFYCSFTEDMPPRFYQSSSVPTQQSSWGLLKGSFRD